MGRVMNPGNASILWKGIVYAQGFPLFITLVTWIVDQRWIQLQQKIGLQQIPDFDTTLYPNARVVSCYLPQQSQDPNNWTSYFITPELIYAQSVQLLLWISDIILIGKTVHYIWIILIHLFSLVFTLFYVL